MAQFRFRFIGLYLAISIFNSLAWADETKIGGTNVPVSEEVLERWTPGGNTNAADLPYPQITASFQLENDDVWIDGRWQQTQKGPFLSHSFVLPGHKLGPKLIAVDSGPGCVLVYDIKMGAFVCGLVNGGVQIDPARFGLLNQPTLAGGVAFHVARAGTWRLGTRDRVVEQGTVDYRGLYLCDDRVLFVANVAGVEVLESARPSNLEGVLIRELQVEAHDAEIWLSLAEGTEIVLREDGTGATWKGESAACHSIELLGPTPGLSLEIDGSTVLLHLAASSNAAGATLRYITNHASGNDVPDGSIGDSDVSEKIPELQRLKVAGGRRWGQPVITRGELATDGEKPYVVDRISPPRENRFNALFFLAGLDFFPNGDAALCTAHGDVWIVRGLDATLHEVTWQRFATGLYQPLGLEIVDGKVIVLGRDQLTRLHDTNSDGEADFYESFNNDLVILGQPHAYVMRLERLPDGRFVFLKSGGGPQGGALLELGSDGHTLTVLAHGFRHPFGLGTGPNGEITVADNEGNWVPSSKIDLVRPGAFYGFLGAASEQGSSPAPSRPLCYLPKVADNSSGGQVWHTSDRWGSYHRDGMFHFSWGRCTLHAVLEQQVNDMRQAATVEVPGVHLQAGPGEAEFSPSDGQLYVVGLDGWQTAATVDGTLERIRCTGKPVRLPSSFAAYEDGIEIGLNEPIDKASLMRSDAVHVEQWNYKWSSTYGSYHYSVREPERVGHDVLELQGMTVSENCRKLFLEIAGLQPVDQIQISLDLSTQEGKPLRTNLYGTINALAQRRPNMAFVKHDVDGGASLVRLLSKDNLVAWCIVPFDAKRRGPEERATMLERLGIRRVAYDWRDEHVTQFDEEIEAYERHNINLHAFWMPVDTASPLTEKHWPLVLDLIDRHKVKPELWVMLSESLVDSFPTGSRAARAAEILATVSRAAAKHGCKIGLYNHGGWFGEPDHQIAIIKELKKHRCENVGIVYNFHHGHHHIDGFTELAKRMAPYLLTVNVNGMRADGPKIVSFGRGDADGSSEWQLLRSLVAAGYRGPIGILGHREDRDVEECLREGLEEIERKLQAD